MVVRFPEWRSWPWPVMREGTRPLTWVHSRIHPPRVVLRVCLPWTMGSRPMGRRSGSQLRMDAGVGPSVWLTLWFLEMMWPVEAIPWVSPLRAVDIWFPEREA
jgi:hypothetical protein